MDIYTVTWPQDSEGAVARKPNGWWPPKFGERELLPEWSIPTFVVNGTLVDLQPNDAGVKILSSRMQNAVEKSRSPSDRIEWLPVHLQSGDAIHEYAIPHLLDELDVIDRKQSILNRATCGVIKAHLRADAIDGHRVFTYSNATGIILLFTEHVYETLKLCTGCAFSKIKTSYPEAQA